MTLLVNPANLSRARNAAVFGREQSGRTLCVATQSLSHVRLFVTLWAGAYQAPLSMEFFRQEHWLLLLLLSHFSRVRLCVTP